MLALLYRLVPIRHRFLVNNVYGRCFFHSFLKFPEIAPRFSVDAFLDAPHNPSFIGPARTFAPPGELIPHELVAQESAHGINAGLDRSV